MPIDFGVALENFFTGASTTTMSNFGEQLFAIPVGIINGITNVFSALASMAATTDWLAWTGSIAISLIGLIFLPGNFKLLSLPIGIIVYYIIKTYVI
jgi:hypothetical protein